MRTTWNTSHRNLLPALLLPALLWAGTAWARQPLAVPKALVVGQTMSFVVDGADGVFELPVHPQVLTSLHFTGPVREGLTDMTGYRLQFKEHRAFLKPDPNVEQGVLTNVHLFTDDYQVSMLLRVVDRPEDAVALGVVRQRTEAERQRATAAKIQRAVHLHETELRTSLEEAYRRRMRNERMHLARAHLLTDSELLPIIDETASDTGPVRARLGPGFWMREELWTSFELANDDGKPLRVEEVYIAGANGKIALVEEITVESPGVPEQGLITRIPPGQRARGVMRVPDAIQGMEPRAVMFHLAGIPRPVVAATEDWVLVPRRRSHIDADKAARGRVALRLQALGGAIWLANPLAAESTDPTSLRGLGVRATVGINRMLAFEAVAAGARSGESRFADVTWNDTQGNLLRSAALGRVHFGGVLHTGKRYISFVRLGLGLQGTSSETQIETAGDARMPGPEVAFAFEGLVTFGTGLEIRLGKHFLAGVAASTVFLGGLGELQSIEAAVHLGYSWKP